MVEGSKSILPTAVAEVEAEEVEEVCFPVIPALS